MRYKYYKRPGRAYKVNRKRSRLAHEMTNGPASQKALSVSGHTNHAGSFICIHPNTTGDHTSAFQITTLYHIHTQNFDSWTSLNHLNINKRGEQELDMRCFAARCIFYAKFYRIVFQHRGSKLVNNSRLSSTKNRANSAHLCYTYLHCAYR